MSPFGVSSMSYQQVSIAGSGVRRAHVEKDEVNSKEVHVAIRQSLALTRGYYL